MGNLEKLVVLTVFFLAAVVLAVSMNSGSPALAGDTPAADLGRRVDGSLAARAEGQRPRSLGAPLTAEPTGATADRTAQDGAVADAATAPSAAPLESPADRPAVPLLSAAGQRASGASGVLGEADGLVPTLSEHYSSYTCREGDTFAGLARRFYGSSEYAAALREANPDVLLLDAGTQLTVPRDARPAPMRETALPAQPVRRPPAPVAQTEVGSTGDVDGRLGTEFREHVLERGETLSHVAETYYGEQRLWRRIFDANRDVIDDPDRVSPGTLLRIP